MSRSQFSADGGFRPDKIFSNTNMEFACSHKTENISIPQKLITSDSDKTGSNKDRTVLGKAENSKKNADITSPEHIIESSRFLGGQSGTKHGHPVSKKEIAPTSTKNQGDFFGKVGSFADKV